MNPFIPEREVVQEPSAPQATAADGQPALPRWVWLPFAALCIVFFYSIRWYAGADVRSAGAATADRYHLQMSRYDLEKQIMVKVRIPWEKHVSVGEIERLYNGGKPLRHIPPPYNIPQGLTVVVPDTLLGLPDRGIEARLWFLNDRFTSTNVNFPQSMQVKQVFTPPAYAASPRRARELSMTAAKFCLGLCGVLALAAIFLPGRRQLIGQLVKMAAILTVLGIGFASPLGPEKFVTAMFGALVLAGLYYLKARVLMRRLANWQGQ